VTVSEDWRARPFSDTEISTQSPTRNICANELTALQLWKPWLLEAFLGWSGALRSEVCPFEGSNYPAPHAAAATRADGLRVWRRLPNVEHVTQPGAQHSAAPGWR